MYGGDTHQRPPQGPPTPPHHQFQQHPPPHDFPRGPFPPPGPPPPHLMRQPSASSTTNAPPHEFHHHQQHQQQHPYHMHQQQQPAYDSHADSYAVKRLRKIGQRRAVDYTSTVVQFMKIRMFQQDSSDRTMLQPTPAAAIDLLPPAAYVDNPSTSFAAKFVHTSLNKNRCSINRVVWTPSGRRLITGSQSGEFTLWNGQSFNFEMILQAHEQAVRSMVWSYNENWMVTGDDSGSIKYWQNNMNNVKANKSAHKESVRGLSFCRTDLKFCSCSDDTTVKVWDFARCQEERSLSGNVLQAGHGWDVKCVDWHPTKSLLVSGGKDNLVKLWDAKSGRELCSFHGHKNNVLCVKWNQNGNWVLTASKDQIIKLYDIRAMKELQSFRGHRKDVTALAWHPFHEEYFVSGSFDGSIFHWLVGHETPQVEIQNAHDSSVWDLAWHPIGYLLCSGGNDHATKFWCRNRPGDPAVDKLPPGPNQGFGEQAPAMGGRMPIPFPMPEPHTIPGGPFGNLTRNEGTIPGIGAAMPLSVPSLDSSDQKPAQSGSMTLGPPPLPPGPHPSLLTGNTPQPYQQNAPPQLQQHQSMLMPPQQPNMPPHMQHPSHMPMLQQHHNLPRPPPQLQPHNNPSSMPGGPMGGPMAQGGPYMGGGGPSNPASGQMYHQPAGGFSRPPPGQMQMIPGINPYQSGNPNAPNMPSNYNLPSMPHGHAHQ